MGPCDCRGGVGAVSSAGSLFSFNRPWFLEPILISPELATLFIPPGPSHVGRLFMVTWQRASGDGWLMVLEESEFSPEIKSSARTRIPV